VADDARPVLNQINLVVRDMDAMVEFYRRLGVEIPDPPAPWASWAPHHRKSAGPEGLEFELDSQVFATTWNQGWRPDAAGAVVGFRIATREGVDQAYADLTGAGYRGQQPPYDAFWGARYAVVEDPDGNSVGLMSPMDPARRTPTPPPPD
jgi:catechol 2,3-dioxygenase-like lactoylglutathione lyase family enzyme